MSENSKLFTALAAALAEIKQPKKTATNPHFKSKFADLEACFDSVREPLLKHEIFVTQLLAEGTSGPVLITRLQHVSGEFLHSNAPLPKDATPQQLGSAITYMRRYALCAMLGLVAEPDDDGNAASAPASGFVSKASAKTAAQESFKVAAAKATTLEGLEKAKAAVAGMDGDETIAKAYAEAKARLTAK
jgi:hypothetical protein